MDMDSTPLPAPFDKLPHDLLEEILAHLPFHSCVTASSVCKLWRALLRPGSYCRRLATQHFGRRPWFFLVGLNHFLAAKNQAFVFNPESGLWHHIPSFKMPPCDHGSLTGTHGLLCALSGTGICKIGYTPCLINNSGWRETPPLQFSRRCPVLAMVENRNIPTCRSKNHNGSGYRIVVAGGKAVSNQLVVEIYDPKTGAWQPCAPLPPQFQCSSSSHWMHSAVHDGRFIVYETYTGIMASLDLDCGSWTKVALVKPPDSVYAFLVACGKSLILAGLCGVGRCFKLWYVNPATLGYTELGQMPDRLFSLYHEEDDDEKDHLISCVGGGDFIYFYSDLWHKDYQACLCDLSGGKIIWRKLPHLPPPVNRFDKVACFSSFVESDALF